MPLTPAHPAVVLPLQRLGLPLSGLVAGAVAPDLPVYLPVGVSYATTHSGPGLAADLTIGLVVLWLWFALVRDAVVDLTPPLRRRAPALARPGRRAWLLAPFAVTVGAATHVLWDSATHDWGFLVRELGPLREAYLGIPLYRWSQHLSTAAGSVVVAAYCLTRLSGLPVTPRRPAVPGSPLLWWVPVLLAALAVGVLRRDPEAAVGAALLVLLAVASVWRAARRRVRRRPSRESRHRR